MHLTKVAAAPLLAGSGCGSRWPLSTRPTVWTCSRRSPCPADAPKSPAQQLRFQNSTACHWGHLITQQRGLGVGCWRWRRFQRRGGDEMTDVRPHYSRHTSHCYGMTLLWDNMHIQSLKTKMYKCLTHKCVTQDYFVAPYPSLSRTRWRSWYL